MVCLPVQLKLIVAQALAGVVVEEQEIPALAHRVDRAAGQRVLDARAIIPIAQHLGGAPGRPVVDGSRVPDVPGEGAQRGEQAAVGQEHDAGLLGRRNVGQDRNRHLEPRIILGQPGDLDVRRVGTFVDIVEAHEVRAAVPVPPALWLLGKTRRAGAEGVAGQLAALTVAHRQLPDDPVLRIRRVRVVVPAAGHGDVRRRGPRMPAVVGVQAAHGARSLPAGIPQVNLAGV